MSSAPPERRVCVEFLPPAELARPSVVRLLAAHRAAPMLAVRPGEDEAALTALAPYVAMGLGPVAWPLLADADGYWPSTANVAAFSTRVEALLLSARRAGLVLPWLAIDLEPPVHDAGRGARGSSPAALPRAAVAAVGRLDRRRFARGTAVFAALHQRIARAGTRTLAIAYPFVSADLRRGGTTMQELCEAPLEAGWDQVAIMTYGSMIAGYSRGLLGVEDARWYGFRALGRLASAFGPRAGAFIGVVGHGKLGDEPCYDDPAELGRDAAAARAAGVSHLGLFCLEGILDRPDPERWLSAFFAPACTPPFCARGELLHRSIEAGALGAGLLAALLRR